MGEFETRRLVVDGELFEVSAPADRPDHLDHDWLSGPNRGYGFTSVGPPGWTPDIETIEQAIRDFLADIDPATGYLADTDDEDL